MPEPFECNFSKEEIIEIYNRPNMTQKKMCEIIGCKSDITLRKILHKNGIDTNVNKRTAYKKRGNRTDEEFKQFLLKEYSEKRRSMSDIAKELGISWVIVSRYLDKYNIYKRSKSEQQTGTGASNWSGGIGLHNGYISILRPNHPNARTQKYVYHHIIVAEKKLGRYLKKGEVVHHIDFNKTNNDPNNLVVLTSSDHMRLHNMLRKGIPYEKAILEVNVIEK